MLGNTMRGSADAELCFKFKNGVYGWWVQKAFFEVGEKIQCHDLGVIGGYYGTQNGEFMERRTRNDSVELWISAWRAVLNRANTTIWHRPLLQEREFGDGNRMPVWRWGNGGT
jgi:hypothetical protein